MYYIYIIIRLGIRLHVLHYHCDFGVVRFFCPLCSCVAHEAAQYRPRFGFTLTVPPKKNGKKTSDGAKQIPPPCCITAEKIPPCFAFICRIPPNQYRHKPKTGSRHQNVTAVLNYPNKNIAIYIYIFAITAHRQRRSLQVRKNRNTAYLPREKPNRLRIAIRPRLSSPEKPLPTLTLTRATTGVALFV